MKKVCAVILAAGDGKRMKSKRPKVLCEVLFKPMIHWVLDTCAGSGIVDICVVVGAGAQEVKDQLPGKILTVEQTQRLGTGHAVQMAAQYIQDGGYDDVVVLSGDVPFVRSADLQSAYTQHKEQDNVVTVLSAKVKDPSGYGRIVRDGRGIAAIVEEKDATQDIKEINEINSGTYWFNAKFLLWCLDGKLQNQNAQGEYYLTDTVALAVEDHTHTADAHVVSPDAVLGANDRRSLQELNSIARRWVLDSLLDKGVNIPVEDGIIVGIDAGVGADTTILPGTIIRGSTIIGEGCEIGPNTYIDNCRIGDGCRIISSYIDSSEVKDNVKIGPMSNIRPGCEIGSGAKIGDFVEIKNSVIGEHTAVAHLTYVGDTDVGKDCNFGCGVVTVNYDGSNKHRTVIGDDVFIGCNANLVAPVKLGNRSYAAAGTTVTEDVPEDALVIGRAKQHVVKDWSKERGKFKKKKK